MQSLTVAADIRLTATTFVPNTRRVLSHARVAIPVGGGDRGPEGVTDRLVEVSGPRALGPVNNFMHLEGTGPFIIETAHVDHENPQVSKVVRTPIDRLYLIYGQMVAVTLLPAANADPRKPVQVRAYFG